jgi:protein phosphatase
MPRGDLMLKASVQTHMGMVRPSNEDSVFVSAEPIGLLPNLFIIADGMGGHKGGGTASKLAISCFCEHIRSSGSLEDTLDILTSAALEANESVLSQGSQNQELSGMGTTLTACSIGDGKAYIVHIGDSRAYLVTQETITQLTNDHSYVNEMVKAGQLTQNEAREHPRKNVLTRVLGISSEMSADGYVTLTEPGSVILLCSDGLYNMVPEEEIKSLINTSEDPAAALVAAANAAGGTDNISAVVISV